MVSYLSSDAFDRDVGALAEKQVDDGVAFCVLQAGGDHEGGPSRAILYAGVSGQQVCLCLGWLSLSQREVVDASDGPRHRDQSSWWRLGARRWEGD